MRVASKNKKHSDEALRSLAARELQALLRSEPHLAKAFKQLAQKSAAKPLRVLCTEGVRYTNRRVQRIKRALKILNIPRHPRPSSGLDGLIQDALRAGTPSKSVASDTSILAAIERISHYGLAIYTSIDRYLRTSGSSEARKILRLSLKEKREAIDEMKSMACREFIPKLHKKRK